MSTCYVMVGLPASGKSTRVRAMNDMDPDVFVYSTDDLIEEWAAKEGKTYNEAFADFISDAQKEMDYLLKCAIRDGMNIIWDQTNLTIKKRRSIIDRMRQSGYRVECECFLQPETVEDIAEWNRRLHSRPGKNIPEHIIKNMINTYVLPVKDEGFDNLVYWNIYGNLQNVEDDPFDNVAEGLVND